MNKFEKARLEYKPDKIDYLLVAETPPKKDSNRFFYFENVFEQDSLFIETMKVLYPKVTSQIETKVIRNNKEKFLKKFRDNGFYLIDSLDKPFEKRYSSSQKVKLIKEGQNNLLSKIKELCSKTTKVILIAAPVYRANYEFLKTNGVNIVNTELIDFPGSGGQKKFRTKIKKLLDI